MKKNNSNKIYKVDIKKVNSKVLTFNYAFVSRENYNNLARKYKDLSNKFAQLCFNPDEEVTCYRRQYYNNYELNYYDVCSWCSTELTKDMRYCPYCGRKIVEKNIVSLQSSLYK